MSVGSLKISQINRAFLCSYKGLYEASVVTVDNNGEPIYPYFSKNILKEYIEDYLSTSIKRYTKNFEIGYKFYLQDGQTECGEKDYARNIKISINANINYLFTYNKTQSISIKDKNNLWT